jgi:hypothetical protein
MGGGQPEEALDDLELLADVPFVMQGGRILKARRTPYDKGRGRILRWEGGRAPLSAGRPYFPA